MHARSELHKPKMYNSHNRRRIGAAVPPILTMTSRAGPRLRPVPSTKRWFHTRARAAGLRGTPSQSCGRKTTFCLKPFD